VSWEQRLHRTRSALTLAWRTKRWTPQALAGLNIGWDGQRFTLPIRDAKGTLVNVCRYRPGAHPKMLACRSRPRDLFPAPELARDSLGPRRRGVYLVEGEPDAISAASIGILAIAVPGSAGWRTEWAPRFAGMYVRMLADHDESGERLGATAAHDLARYAASVRVLDWRDVIGREPAAGYDLGAWICDSNPEAGAA
jgi:hypothetical protein